MRLWNQYPFSKYYIYVTVNNSLRTMYYERKERAFFMFQHFVDAENKECHLYYKPSETESRLLYSFKNGILTEASK